MLGFIKPYITIVLLFYHILKISNKKLLISIWSWLRICASCVPHSFCIMQYRIILHMSIEIFVLVILHRKEATSCDKFIITFYSSSPINLKLHISDCRMELGRFAKWWIVNTKRYHCDESLSIPPAHWPSGPGQELDQVQGRGQWTAST